jgi:hypothetical protein
LDKLLGLFFFLFLKIEKWLALSISLDLIKDAGVENRKFFTNWYFVEPGHELVFV